ncbi:MAG: bifunctional 3,4-dihydroxy-2-butanone-4-phosphate synthase/GTP cyclohydrolase II [Cyanobacteria bacterium P01_A01_bin.105]
MVLAPVPDPSFEFDSIEAALADLAAGRSIVVVDDENRENEGDVICAAQFATPDMINFMAVEARGLICLAMQGDRLDQLDLPLMVSSSAFEDENEQTAFTVSIDAGPEWGVTTGISAEDRARTIQVAINPKTRPQELRRPGHIFPLRAKAGGVLKRAGHTEAGVDLAKLAGLYPAGVICEIQNADGSMARLPELITYAQQHRLKLISIADLISYRLRHERLISREAIAALPSQFGDFQIYAYRHQLDNSEHVALVKGDPATFEHEPVMVRMHSECLTGDALGSLRCDCRMQLQAALKMIENAGKGVVVYLRQEGRGIGLVNKLRAYSLQDQGFDTVEANERLGLPVDQRNYGMGAQMLMDLGVRQFRLITNNPRKIAGLKGYGLEMVDRVPLLIEATVYNADYLATKAEKLGHLMLQTYLATVALHWRGMPPAAQRYERLAQLRQLAQADGLLLQEEARSVAISLFGPAALIFNLGLAQPNKMGRHWYRAGQQGTNKDDYRYRLSKILAMITTWPDIEQLDFLISSGSDPFTTLQVRLERQPYPWDAVALDDIFEQLDTQRIYTLSKHGAGQA